MPDFVDYNMSPEQLLELYNNGFQGVTSDRSAYMAMRYIPTFYEAFPEAKGSGAGKVSSPFKAALSLDPEFGKYESQTTGDCSDASCLVRTSYGELKPIIDIKIGDYVLSHRNIARKVTDFIKKPYSGKMLRIYVDGLPTPINLTPDHKVITYPDITLAMTGKKNWRKRTERMEGVPAGQLKIGDRVCVPYGVRNDNVPNKTFDLLEIFPELECVEFNKVAIKNGRKEVIRYIDLDEDLSWLFGIFLAEGSCSVDNCKIQFSLSINEKELAKKIVLIINNKFGLYAKIHTPPSRDDITLVEIYSKVLSKFIHYLMPGNVYSKKVPICVLESNYRNRLACLRGWMDGDGHLNIKKRKGKQSKFYYCSLTGVTSSPNLANTMFSLAMSLGLRPTIFNRKKAKHQRVAAQEVKIYGSAVCTIYPEVITQVNKQTKLYKHYSDVTQLGFACKIKKIEEYELKDDYVYCLEVEEDHTFQGNFINIFNCVSHGTRNAGMIDYCIDAMFGETTYEGRFATENIYGYRGHSGQGANCSRLAAYVSQDGPGGFLTRKTYTDGTNSVDLSVYKSSIGANWGGRGTPAWLNKIAETNKALKVFQINSLEEARDAIASGFGISACSGYGFASTRNSDGLCEQRGSWSHCMAWIGVDDSSEMNSKYSGPLVLIQNSWGVWNGGPKRNDQPDGSFYVRPKVAQAILSGGESYCIASVRGFNRQLVYDTTSKIQGLNS